MSRPSPAHLVFTFALLLVINVSVPWLFIGYFKWRLRCTNCGYRWRGPPQHSHAELTRMAEGADTAA